MTNSFKILAGFLDRFSLEVEGRGLAEPPEDIRVKLRALVLGSLPSVEHESLFSLLDHNPDWFAHLAEQIRTLRAKPNKQG